MSPSRAARLANRLKPLTSWPPRAVTTAGGSGGGGDDPPSLANWFFTIALKA